MGKKWPVTACEMGISQIQGWNRTCGQKLKQKEKKKKSRYIPLLAFSIILNNH